jgi:hypothetical protein
METKTHQSRKTSFFQKESWLSQAKFVWKTLVVLILSVLLFAPTPVLAFDYNNGTLQSYVSNVKVELDGVLTSIKKLQTLSYENGQKNLAEIDTKLQKMQTDARNSAKDFKKFSDEAQKEYANVLDQINNQYASREKGQFVLPAYQTTNLPSLTNGLNNPVSVNIVAEGKWNYGSQSPFSTLVNANGNPGSAGIYQANLRFPNVNPAALVTVKNDKVLAFGMQNKLELRPGETVLFINNDVAGNYGDNSGSQTITYSFSNNDKNYFFSTNDKNVTIKSNQQELDSKIKKLSEGIVLANKASKLCDDLDKRIKLATQKLGNVKEYASALSSFSDPDVLSEITELDNMVANLTKNLPNS